MTEILGEGYGMPSSHSQFMAFFAVYVTLYLLHRYGTLENCVNVGQRKCHYCYD
jgi:membrane-associated phospholipid phosphatase